MLDFWSVMKKKKEKWLNLKKKKSYGHWHILWGLVWLFNIEGECREQQYFLKVPPSTQPRAWIRHFQTVDVWFTEHRRYHVWWAGQSHCSLRLKRLLLALTSLRLAFKGGREKKKKGKRDANHLSWGEQGLRKTETDREMYTERCLCLCQCHFFGVRLKFSNRIRISACSVPACLYIWGTTITSATTCLISQSVKRKNLAVEKHCS